MKTRKQIALRIIGFIVCIAVSVALIATTSCVFPERVSDAPPGRYYLAADGSFTFIPSVPVYLSPE